MVEPAAGKPPSLFGPLPTRGIWTALDLSRAQFLLIVIASLAAFVFVGGPVWAHARESHFWRIGLSYAVIPVLVAAALRRNGKTRLIRIVVGSAVIALIKLVVTAALLVAIVLAQG